MLAPAGHTALPANAQWVRARFSTGTTQHCTGRARPAAAAHPPACRSARGMQRAAGGGALAMSRLSDGTHLIPSSTCPAGGLQPPSRPAFGRHSLQHCKRCSANRGLGDCIGRNRHCAHERTSPVNAPIRRESLTAHRSPAARPRPCPPGAGTGSRWPARGGCGRTAAAARPRLPSRTSAAARQSSTAGRACSSAAHTHNHTHPRSMDRRRASASES